MALVKASSLVKGQFIIIKGRPCQIINLTDSVLGKLQRPTIIIIGIDIFTDRKYETFHWLSDDVLTPDIVFEPHKLVNIENDILHLINDGTLTEMKLPDDKKFSQKIQDDFKLGKDITLIIVESMGEKKLVDTRF